MDNGKVYSIEEAERGDNLPPLHPNCRSSILPFSRDYIEQPENAEVRELFLSHNEHEDIIKLLGNMEPADYYQMYIDAWQEKESKRLEILSKEIEEYKAKNPGGVLGHPSAEPKNQK